jgi:hypothetical protein
VALMANPEIWQIVPSVPWILASTRGRVMVVPSLGEMPHGGIRHYGSRARTGCWDGKRYILQHDKKTYKVARLVCEAFKGPPPFDGAVCMHVDENPRNNLPGNLQWGTQKENLNAPGFLEYCRNRTGENSPFVKGRRKANG